MQRCSECDPEREDVIRLGDGRTLSFRTYGRVDGLAVLALHGTPGSRLKFRSLHGEAHRLGLRIIAPDRWGYGRTQAPDDAGLIRYGKDAAELMVHCGVQHFAVVGVSGGGPFATAVAAVLPDQVVGLALVAPVGRFFTGDHRSAQGLNGLRIDAFHRLCFLMLPRVPGATRLIFQGYRLLALAAPATAISVALLRAAAGDKRTMRPHHRRRALGQAFAAGLARGVDGAVIDLRLFAGAWGFEPAVIRCPTRVWIGEADRNVPIDAAVALGNAIGGARVTRVADQGHFWIAANFSGVLSWLAGIPSGAED